jgi:hypothetical protein
LQNRRQTQPTHCVHKRRVKDPPTQSKADDSDANLSVNHSTLSISLTADLS